MSSFLYRLGRSSAAHPWRVIAPGSCSWPPPRRSPPRSARRCATTGTCRAPASQRGLDLLREHGVGGFASARVVVHDREGDALPSAEIGALTERLRDLEHVADVGPARLSADARHRRADRAVRRAHHAPRPDGQHRAAGGRDRRDDRRRPAGRARRRAPRHRRRGLRGHRRARRRGHRPADPGHRLRLRRRRRAADRRGRRRAGGGQLGHHTARRDHGREHVRSDGRLDGGARRRDRLRAAPGHPPRGEPPPRSRRDRGGRPRGRDVRSIGGVRRGHRARLADGPAPRRPVDVRLVRPGHRHRRRVRRRGRPHPRAGAVPAGWSQAASPARYAATARCAPASRSPPAGPPVSAASRSSGRWSASACLLVLAAPVLDLRTWPGDASSQPAQHHAPGVRPRRRRVRSRRERPADRRGADLEPTGAADEAVATLRADDRSPASSRWSPRRTARFDHHRGARPSGPPTSAPRTWSRTCGHAPASAEVTGWTPFFADISDDARSTAVAGDRVRRRSLRPAARADVPVGAGAAEGGRDEPAVGSPPPTACWWRCSSGAGARSYIGVDQPMPVSSWMPILLFAILFGLSMDYEVFLLSRIREDYLRTGDPRGSVVAASRPPAG